MNTTQTHEDAVAMVLSVLRDGRRNDRYLRVADDGHYFTTPDHTFLTADGPETPACVKIPVSYDGTEEDEQAWAESLIAELDELVA